MFSHLDLSAERVNEQTWQGGAPYEAKHCFMNMLFFKIILYPSNKFIFVNYFS